MDHGEAAHALLADARRQVWAVRPEFWDSFGRMLTLDRLAVSLADEPRPMAARRNRAPDKRRTAVGVVPLQGVITPRPTILSALFGGGGGLAAFREQLREAVSDDDLDAIILDIDSPGGSTALVEETAAEVRAAREVKPVVAVANTDAGSAAYWIAAQASEVVVTPSGMAGSIGIFILHVDYSGMNEKLGVEPTYVSAGKYKVDGNPDAPLTDSAAEHLQGVVDETYSAFVRDVAEGRGVRERAVRNGFGEGRMLTAAGALEAGIVDRVETMESVVGRLLGGEMPLGAGPRAEASERALSFSPDETDPDEAPSRVSPSRKSLAESDEALLDEIVSTSH